MRSRFHRQDGAAAVEFALIVGVLTMLVFGMIEYGIFFLQAQTLRAAARGGARQAAVGATKSQIDKAIVDASGGSLPSGYSSDAITVNGSAFSGSGSPCSSSTYGQNVTVYIPVTTSLPSSVLDAFRIDIPFIPTLYPYGNPSSNSTTSSPISGTFRCEISS
jgi:Flp pilus assembly protein TadG